MATELLSIGSTAATSSDFTSDGTAVVFLKGTAGVPFKARVAIDVKDSGGGYTKIADLSGNHLSSAPQSGVLGAGTYRLRRIATGVSVGVEKA